jgi:hypothetical protein
MRIFAWFLIPLGLAAALAWGMHVREQDGRFTRLAADGWLHPADMDRTFVYWTSKRDALSYWPGIIGGGVVSGFGVLLLAIRKPA